MALAFSISTLHSLPSCSLHHLALPSQLNTKVESIRCIPQAFAHPTRHVVAISKTNSKKVERGRSLMASAELQAGRTQASAAGNATTAADAAAGEIPATQKGWSYKEYGSVDVLQLGDVSVPDVADDEVLIKVAAAALNPVDFKRRQGKFPNSDSELPTVPGYDAAGVVVKVGSGVTKFQVGDEVYADVSEHALDRPRQSGTLAQYVAAEQKLVALKPKNLTFAEAAGLPLAILTANEGFERANLQEGQSVLIIGGAGGVASLAIQIAKKVYKAGHVAATASAQKVEFVRGLGADRVIDYTKEKYENLPERYDFVFDTIGEGERSVKAAKEGGVVAVLTGPAPEPAFRFVLTSSGEKLEKLNPYLESGDIKPLVDPKGPFAFADVKAAFAYLETGKAVGKVVVSPIE
eukprot:jgi/Mesen1/779/ME000110S_11045